MTKKNISKRADILRRRYTRISRVGVGWTTYLQIDCQGFSVVDQTTRSRAQWFARMLGQALEKLLAEELKQKGN